VAGQRIGYVRVSTLDQNEKRQLEGQVLDRVFTDKAFRQGHRATAHRMLGFAAAGT
jgi:DNA invertase Pin-like site-specific DNA recombinase